MWHWSPCAVSLSGGGHEQGRLHRQGPSAPSLSGGGAGRRQPETVQLQARGGRGPSVGPHGTGLPISPATVWRRSVACGRRPSGRPRYPAADAQAQAARDTEQAQQLLEEYPSRRRSCPRRLRPSGSMTAAIPPIAGGAGYYCGGHRRRGVRHYGPDPWRECGRVLRPVRPGGHLLLSGAHVLPTAKNNKKAITQEWERSISRRVALLPEGLPGAGPVRPPCGAAAMIHGCCGRVVPRAWEALNVMKGSEGPERLPCR